MLPDMDVMHCQDLAIPMGVMQHVVNVESSFNPYAIGVVGGRLVRQPASLPEALATVRMLEGRGYNYSLGLAQVNRANLGAYGLGSYEAAFRPCENLRAGARILADCLARATGNWGRAFSCYASGNFVTGYRTGYVQKILASMQAGATPDASPFPVAAIALFGAARPTPPARRHGTATTPSARALRRSVADAAMDTRPVADNPTLPAHPQPASAGDQASPAVVSAVVPAVAALATADADAAFIF